MTGFGYDLNNPLNIMDAKQGWQGEVPEEKRSAEAKKHPGYLQFQHAWQGYRAGAIILRGYQEGWRKANTLLAMMSVFAPKGHGGNDPAAYAGKVARDCQMSPVQPFVFAEMPTALNVLRAMTVVELGRYPYEDDKPILEGLRAAGIYNWQEIDPPTQEYTTAVMQLQELLNEFGAGITVDGMLGPKTKAACKNIFGL